MANRNTMFPQSLRAYFKVRRGAPSANWGCHHKCGHCVFSFFSLFFRLVRAKQEKREERERACKATLVVAAPIGGWGPSANFENTPVALREHRISVRHSFPQGNITLNKLIPKRLRLRWVHFCGPPYAPWLRTNRPRTGTIPGATVC